MGLAFRAPRPPDGPSGGSHGRERRGPFPGQSGSSRRGAAAWGTPGDADITVSLVYFGGEGVRVCTLCIPWTRRGRLTPKLCPQHRFTHSDSQGATRVWNTQNCVPATWLHAPCLSPALPLETHLPGSRETISRGPTMCCSRWRRVSGGAALVVPEEPPARCGPCTEAAAGSSRVRRARRAREGTCHTHGVCGWFHFPVGAFSVGDVAAPRGQRPLWLHAGCFVVAMF